MYTRNVREAFRTVGILHSLVHKLYSMTKFPFMPIYGGVPVKLTTHIGPAIPYDGSLTPQQLAAKVSISHQLSLSLTHEHLDANV